MNRQHVPSGTARVSVLLLSVMGMASLQLPATAGTVNLGGGWKATAPNSYNAMADPPAGGAVGDLVPLGQSTTVALPVKLKVPNWRTLREVCITFTNNLKKNDPPPPDHLALSLDIVNKTNRAWSGFKMRITDNNGTAQDGQPNLTHPFYAHYHVGFLEANSVMPFTKIKTSPDYDGGPVAVGPDLTDRGVYSMEFSDGMVMKNGTWAPKVFDLHDRAKTNDAGDYITSFTICLMPIPKGVPEPTSMWMLFIGALLGACRRGGH